MTKNCLFLLYINISCQKLWHEHVKFWKDENYTCCYDDKPYVKAFVPQHIFSSHVKWPTMSKKLFFLWKIQWKMVKKRIKWFKKYGPHSQKNLLQTMYIEKKIIKHEMLLLYQGICLFQIYRRSEIIASLINASFIIKSRRKYLFNYRLSKKLM